MRHLRIREGQAKHSPGRIARALAACMLAAFALAAVAASGASASLPEWGGCEPAAPGHGKYTDPGCTVKVTKETKAQGRYEWYTGAAFGFVYAVAHGKKPLQLNGYTFGEVEEGPIQIGHSTFETAAHKKMECQEGSIFFALENANTKGVRNVWLALNGCESEGLPCTGNNREAGEVTNEEQWNNGETLKGTLGFIKRGNETEPPEVGLSLTAFRTPTQWKEKNEAEGLKRGEYTSAEPLLFATCEAPGPESVGNLKIGGNKKGGNYIIAVIKPVDTMTTEYNMTYTQSAGVQNPAAFEGRKTTGLLGFTESIWQPVGISASIPTLRPEEHFTPELWLHVPPIEIKATP